MYRIALSGPKWTGKSTTIKLLLPVIENMSTDVIALTKLVSQCPHSMGTEQTVEASRWMLNRVSEILESESTADLQIFDRSPIDILAFTQYAIDRAGLTGNDQALLDEIARLAPKFNRFFFLNRSESWPVEEHLDEEISFEVKIEGYMKSAIEKYAIETTPLPWSLDERLTILKHAIPT